MNQQKRIAEWLASRSFSVISAGAGSTEYKRGNLVISLLSEPAGFWDIVHDSDLSVSIASGKGFNTFRQCFNES